MSASGPAIHIDYGHAFPYQIEADTSLDLTGQDIVFRVGIPGPVNGEIQAPLIEHVATVTSTRKASGVVPASMTRLSTDVVYGYHISLGTGETRRLLLHGNCSVRTTIGASG